jgi:hypothetical protein
MMHRKIFRLRPRARWPLAERFPNDRAAPGGLSAPVRARRSAFSPGHAGVGAVIGGVSGTASDPCSLNLGNPW